MHSPQPSHRANILTKRHAVWSPNGRYLLFSSGRFGYKDEGPLYDDVPQPYAELFVMNADGSHQRPLTDNALRTARQHGNQHFIRLRTRTSIRTWSSRPSSRN